MLPKLLPDLDYCIYADVDTVFCGDLVEASMIDLKDNYIAAVPESPGMINSGFLIMNLSQIRKDNIYDKLVSVSQTERYHYPDQTLLNNVCKSRIMHLPIKYNLVNWSCYNQIKNPLSTDKDLYELRYNTVMVHFTGNNKPWKNKNAQLADIWWRYAEQTGLFSI
jgi:lipopolysaccharide biosynthesis glycosyltransferase